MKRKWKFTLAIVLALVVAGGIFASVRISQRGVVTVQTGKVIHEDLAAIVTASGEIKPKDYHNLGANAMGPLTAIYVKEGDHVKRGQTVAQIEAVQPKADVEAQKANIQSSLSDSAAAEAALAAQQDGVRTAQATVEKSQAELERTKANLDRANALLKDRLIAKQDYDQKAAEYSTAVAALAESTTRLAQAKAQVAQSRQQMESAQRRVAQMRANLARFEDILAKFSVVSPIDGVVTNLPVREGETVVQGVQNSAASTIMTVADMSLITAEVKVDETDIVNVALNQTADVSIDAIPNKTFKGHVIEIGNTAILRSTGLAASQSAVSSQEAKDFKVVVALDNPPDEVRPGLSCTAKITTATRHNALAIPIQALTVRQKGDLEKPKPGAPAVLTPAEQKARRVEEQGVFVVKGERAEFRKVDTGITGATDIEVLSGLKPDEQIVTGTYQVIRTLRNDTKVKVDNKPPVIKAS
ncbi:MAG TPA: efflux RND transporter periplasmic adaptor subunit [Bryobacteraceae bacterium]|nr:efflux RND transporter periplasmic adaptor subunit [Bryobacteraceae bacterium]